MSNGDAAYKIMRSQGLGISNANIKSIPSVSTPQEMRSVQSKCSQNSLANKLRGRIVLQVESRGEAWYIDPSKCHSIYLKDGDAAYQVMRYLGIGIKNTDLDKIATADLAL